MSNKVIRKEDLLRDTRMQNVTNYGAQYGVAAAVIDYHTHVDMADSGFYIVAGLGKLPDISEKGTSPKEIEEMWKRNEDLFYPFAYAERITPENIDVSISHYNAFCQHAEVLNALYNQYKCQIPEVLRASEVSNLVHVNHEANNRDRSWALRACYEKEIDRFFDNEKRIAKSKGHKEFMDYVRSDRFDGLDKHQKKNLTYYKLKGKQDIPLNLLTQTGAEIIRASVSEEYFQRMVKNLEYTPYVMYSVGELKKMDMGRIDDNLDPWKGEQRYFEYRVFYFKKVDEPEMAAAYIRAKYLNVNTKDSISNDAKITAPAINGRPVARYIAPRNMDAFIDAANQMHLQYTFDYHGILLEPSFLKFPVMVSKSDAPLLDSIIKAIDENSFERHAVYEENLPYLNDTVQIAEIKRSALEGQAQVPGLPPVSVREAEVVM